MLGLLVTLPFSVKSVVDDVFGSVTGRVVRLTRGRPDSARPNHTKLHMAFVSIAEISEVTQLPVRGHPIHYPFDTYSLVVGVALQRLRGDSQPQSLSVAEASGHLFLSV